MKKFILAMVTLFTMTVSTASAMSYEQARQQALFLTDKMAYELNLTDDQYEAAYEVNLDYLMGVWSILETAQRRLELHSPRLAIQSLPECHLLLSPTLLERRLLAFRHLRKIPSPRLLLLRTPSLLHRIQRRTQLAQERRKKLVQRTYLWQTTS